MIANGSRNCPDRQAPLPRHVIDLVGPRVARPKGHCRVCSELVAAGSTAPLLTRVQTPAVTGACLLCIGFISAAIVACAIAITSHTLDTTAVWLCGSAAPFDCGNTEC